VARAVTAPSARPISAADSAALDRLCAALRAAVSTGTSATPPDAAGLIEGVVVLVRLGRDDADPAEADTAGRGWRVARLPLPPPLGRGVVADGPGGELNLQLGAGGRPTMGAWSAPRDAAPEIALFDVRPTKAGTVLHIGSGAGDAVELPISADVWGAPVAPVARVAPVAPVAPVARVAPVAPVAPPPRVAPPAVPYPPWLPTCVVGYYPLPARAVADPNAPVLAVLGPGTRLRVVETLGAWAHVDAPNGWAAWVDGRMLVSLGGGAAAAPAAR
jgi:hypothetical protein